MPGLNVSDVLSDPDFADTFDVIRDVTDVDDDGVSQEANGPIVGISGVVQPASGSTLMRIPDGSRLASTIEIYTTFGLTAGVEGQGADQVVYQSILFTITSVDDWSRYGAGYVKATAQMADLVPPPV